MDEGQVFSMVGQIHLAQLGNPAHAARLIGELAEARARIRKSGEPSIHDVQNVVFKLCDWWPNKPQDWRGFMAVLRPQLLAAEEGGKIAEQIFYQDFLALDLRQTAELFRDRLNFFAPDGDFPVINNNAIPGAWEIRARFDGKTFRPPFAQ